MIRTLLTRLTTDVAALRDELARMADARDQFRREVERLSWELNRATEERDRFRILAGSTAPTPAERAVLDVVARMPGALAKEIGRAIVEADGPPPWAVGVPNWPGDAAIAEAVKPLTALHRKGLVRRERAGQSFRYWIADATP